MSAFCLSFGMSVRLHVYLHTCVCRALRREPETLEGELQLLAAILGAEYQTQVLDRSSQCL